MSQSDSGDLVHGPAEDCHGLHSLIELASFLAAAIMIGCMCWYLYPTRHFRLDFIFHDLIATGPSFLVGFYPFTISLQQRPSFWMPSFHDFIATEAIVLDFILS